MADFSRRTSRWQMPADTAQGRRECALRIRQRQPAITRHQGRPAGATAAPQMLPDTLPSSLRSRPRCHAQRDPFSALVACGCTIATKSAARSARAPRGIISRTTPSSNVMSRSGCPRRSFRATTTGPGHHPQGLAEQRFSRRQPAKAPYIVAVHDAGVSASSAYLVMEYLPGGTLEPYTRPGHAEAGTGSPRDHVQSAPARSITLAAPASSIATSSRPTCSTSGMAKPKVCDFGAAYWAKDDSTQVMDIGSLAYMAGALPPLGDARRPTSTRTGDRLFGCSPGNSHSRADSPASLMPDPQQRPAAPLRTCVPTCRPRSKRSSAHDRPQPRRTFRRLACVLAALSRTAAQPRPTPPTRAKEAGPGRLYVTRQRYPARRSPAGAQLWNCCASRASTGAARHRPRAGGHGRQILLPCCSREAR